MKIGDVIAGRYEVLSCISDAGGMGCVMGAKDSDSGDEVAVKYFKHSGDDGLRERFRREVRLMQGMAESPMVVTVLDAELKHDPPYFVMPIYEKGDLVSASAEIAGDYDAQRSLLLAMCDAVEALHEAGHFHRDIKPANFLRDSSGNVVISDLGFALDPNSSTRQTLSQQGWGTEGYTPPEFRESGGFKSASEAADIFMLGRAFYQVLTGRDPLFVDPSAVEKPLYYVIDKCCRIPPNERFGSITEVRAALELAFDHLTGNLNSASLARTQFDTIQNRLQSLKYRSDEMNEFMDLALSLEPAELFAVLREADPRFFASISQEVFAEKLPGFINAYEGALDASDGLGFSYAEVVADNMRSVFTTSQDEAVRLQALGIAVDWADAMNRFAAMGTCSTLITSIKDGDSIAHGIVAMIAEKENSFIRGIDAVECRNPLIADALKRHNES
tara:strand:- start:4734 stop:6068 length:1335 start_codon:yes stop_codon:yes gene_type:complete